VPVLNTKLPWTLATIAHKYYLSKIFENTPPIQHVCLSVLENSEDIYPYATFHMAEREKLSAAPVKFPDNCVMEEVYFYISYI